MSALVLLELQSLLPVLAVLTLLADSPGLSLALVLELALAAKRSSLADSPVQLELVVLQRSRPVPVERLPATAVSQAWLAVPVLLVTPLAVSRPLLVALARELPLAAKPSWLAEPLAQVRPETVLTPKLLAVPPHRPTVLVAAAC